MGITSNLDYIVIKEYRRFIALRAKISSLTVDINTRGYEFWCKHQEEAYEQACKKVQRYKAYIALAMRDSEAIIKKLTKQVSHRNSKYLNNIVAIFNNGCRCLPVEDDTFFELPKCMEHILTPMAQHTSDARPADLAQESDDLWCVANKPRTYA